MFAVGPTMPASLVCDFDCRADALQIPWSQGKAAFPPYVQGDNRRQLLMRAVARLRETLGEMVRVCHVQQAATQPPTLDEVRAAVFAVAQAGFAVYERLFRS